MIGVKRMHKDALAKRHPAYTAQVLALGAVLGDHVYLSVADYEKLHTPRPKPPQGEKRAVVVGGPELWAELHRAAVDGALNEEWFAAWLSRVPMAGCSCRTSFQTILEAIPVRWDDQFAWSVEVHNAVNRKLGKPEISADQAREIWSS